jgi:hypothetical protein
MKEAELDICPDRKIEDSGGAKQKTLDLEDEESGDNV